MEASFDAFKEQSNNIVLSFDAQSQNVNNRIEATATQMSERQIQASDAAFDAVKSAISRSVGDFEQALNSQIQALDTALEKELQRTISSMGQKLAGITGQFADDYSQLTNQMVRVINQADAASKQIGAQRTMALTLLTPSPRPHGDSSTGEHWLNNLRSYGSVNDGVLVYCRRPNANSVQGERSD